MDSFLKVAVSQEWITLDPGQWASTTTGLNQVYENLFRFKSGTMEIQSSLAEAYEISPDKKTYTLLLRKGVKFHDGTLFNAQAVITSIERARWYKGTGYTWIQFIKDAIVVDDYTVKLVLESPSPLFLTALANPSVLKIVSPAAIKAHEKDGDWAKAWLNENDAGTGPYMLNKTVKMDYIYFESFKDYWGGWKGNRLDKVLFKYVREPSSRKMMLLNKEVHVAEDLLFDDVEDLRKIPDIKVDLPSAGSVAFLLFRVTPGAGGGENPLQNKKVREAINYAVDYDDMIKVAMKGAAKQAQGPTPRWLVEHNSKLKTFRKDIKKAKQLLSEAGYKEGQIKMTVMYNVGFEWKRLVCETLKKNLKDVGIELDIDATTWPRMVSSMQNGIAPPPPHIYMAFVGTIVDGYTLLNRVFHSQSIGSPEKGPRGWNPGYENPAFDKALDAAKVAPAIESYKKFMGEAQEIVHNDLPYVPLWELIYVSAMSKKVKGFVPTPFLNFDYNLYEMRID